jgi:hypothetical protein
VRISVAVVAVAIGLTSCAPSAPAKPPFAGQVTAAWIAFDVPVPAGKDSGGIVESFEAGAKSSGCGTERLAASSQFVGGGELRQWYGVSAECDAGTIALVAVDAAHVRIGCRRPADRDACEAILRHISSAR